MGCDVFPCPEPSHNTFQVECELDKESLPLWVQGAFAGTSLSLQVSGRSLVPASTRRIRDTQTRAEAAQDGGQCVMDELRAANVCAHSDESTRLVRYSSRGNGRWERDWEDARSNRFTCSINGLYSNTIQQDIYFVGSIWQRYLINKLHLIVNYSIHN